MTSDEFKNGLKALEETFAYNFPAKAVKELFHRLKDISGDDWADLITLFEKRNQGKNLRWIPVAGTLEDLYQEIRKQKRQYEPRQKTEPWQGCPMPSEVKAKWKKIKSRALEITEEFQQKQKKPLRQEFRPVIVKGKKTAESESEDDIPF